MKSWITTLAIAATALVSTVASAHDYTAGSIHIDHPWSREAPPTAKVLGGFFQLKNHSTKDDFLISASSPVASHVELHTHTHVDGVMKMEKVDSVRIGSMKTVMFEPGGFHLMIFNPKKAYKEGERYPVTLVFKHAGEVTVDLAVEKSAHVHHHHH